METTHYIVLMGKNRSELADDFLSLESAAKCKDVEENREDYSSSNLKERSFFEVPVFDSHCHRSFEVVIGCLCHHSVFI